MNEERLAAFFNEWQRRYIANPEAFQAEFQTVLEFLSDEANEEEPSYGKSCAAYVLKLDGELER